MKKNRQERFLKAFIIVSDLWFYIKVGDDRTVYTELAWRTTRNDYEIVIFLYNTHSIKTINH